MSYYNKIVSIIDGPDDDEDHDAGSSSGYANQPAAAGHSGDEYVMVSDHGRSGPEGAATATSVSSPFYNITTTPSLRPEGAVDGEGDASGGSLAAAVAADPTALMAIPTVEALAFIGPEAAKQHRALLRDYYNLDLSLLTREQRAALNRDDEDGFVVASEVAELLKQHSGGGGGVSASASAANQSRGVSAAASEGRRSRGESPATVTGQDGATSGGEEAPAKPQPSVAASAASFFGLGGSRRTTTPPVVGGRSSSPLRSSAVARGASPIAAAAQLPPIPDLSGLAQRLEASILAGLGPLSSSSPPAATGSDAPTADDTSTSTTNDASNEAIRRLCGHLGEALARLEVTARAAEEQRAASAVLWEQMQRRDALLDRLRAALPAEVERCEAVEAIVGISSTDSHVNILTPHAAAADPYAAAVEEARGELDAHRDVALHSEPIQRLQAALATRGETIESLERANAALRAQLRADEETREGELAALRAQVETSAFDSLKFTEVFEESARRKAELGRLSRKVATLQQLLDERGAQLEQHKAQSEAMQQLLGRRRRQRQATGEAGGDGSAAITIDGGGGGDGGAGEEDDDDYSPSRGGGAGDDGDAHISGLTSRQLQRSRVYKKLDNVKFGKKLQKGMSTVDFAAVSVGRFLRRHALARLFVAIYVVVIHLYLFGAVFSGLHSLPVDGHDVHDHISNHIDHKHIISPDESN